MGCAGSHRRCHPVSGLRRLERHSRRGHPGLRPQLTEETEGRRDRETVIPINLMFCLLVALSPRRSVPPSPCLSVSLSLRPSVALSLRLSVPPSLRRSVSLYSCLSVLRRRFSSRLTNPTLHNPS